MALKPILGGGLLVLGGLTAAYLIRRRKRPLILYQRWGSIIAPGQAMPLRKQQRFLRITAKYSCAFAGFA